MLVEAGAPAGSGTKEAAMCGAAGAAGVAEARLRAGAASTAWAAGPTARAVSSTLRLAKMPAVRRRMGCSCLDDRLRINRPGLAQGNQWPRLAIPSHQQQ